VASSRHFATEVARIVAQNSKNLQLCNPHNPQPAEPSFFSNKKSGSLAAAARRRRQKRCGASSAR
jgi:hypothetical protein